MTTSTDAEAPTPDALRAVVRVLADEYGHLFRAQGAGDATDAYTVARAVLATPALAARLGTAPQADEHHTLDELYEYRMLYHAHAANEWARHGTYPVVKSWKHSDGEPCFGGGWFIVVATLPGGQTSNHYKAEHWGLFQVPDVEVPPEYDGHTPQVAAGRLRAALDAHLGATGTADETADAHIEAITEALRAAAEHAEPLHEIAAALYDQGIRAALASSGPRTEPTGDAVEPAGGDASVAATDLAVFLHRWEEVLRGEHLAVATQIGRAADEAERIATLAAAPPVPPVDDAVERVLGDLVEAVRGERDGTTFPMPVEDARLLVAVLRAAVAQ